MGSHTSKSGGGGGNSNAQQYQVQDGGGITYTSGGIRFTLEQKNGVMYNVSDLADIPEVVGKGYSGAEIVERLTRSGTEYSILTPKQMQQRRDERNAERAARPDYELGVGVPWGNKSNRQAARRGRIVTRTSKRR